MKRWIWVPAVLLAASFVAAQDRSSRAVEWPYYGGDPGGTRHSPLTDINAGNVQRLQPAWQWKHWETPLKEYDTVPGSVRGDAADDRRHAVRHDAVQQHRRARCGDRQGAVAVRRRGLQARSGAVGQRLEAARHRRLARRQISCACSSTAAIVCSRSTRDRQAGGVVRQQRRGLAHRRPAAHVRHHATRRRARRRSSTATSSSSAARCPTACSCPIRWATCRRSTRAPASACGRSRRFRSRRRIRAPRPGRTSRGARTATPTCGRRWRSTRSAACSICRRPRRPATTTAASVRARICSPSRSCVSTPRPARSSGTSRPCITGCGTGTFRRSRTS